MKWLLRPSNLVLVSVALTLGAAAVVLWPRTPEKRPALQPVVDGDQEIVWLYAATNAVAWERFVTAVNTAARRLESDRPQLGLQVNTNNAFPLNTTAVPELSMAFAGSKGRLWFRWYKLTSDHKTLNWVRALVERQPTPLAIIGGSSSDLAIEMAHNLRDQASMLPEAVRPLLLLTTATADDEARKPRSPGGPLHRIYAQRTQRFCFTNRQMAEAVTDLIWSQNDLRPDAAPVYITWWQDDPYSVDLTERFVDALRRPALQTVTSDWAGLMRFTAQGGLPFDGTSVWWGRFQPLLPVSERIISSVGLFDRPNRWEAESAKRLMEIKLNRYPGQRRPLLVMPAASQPSRRFLRALVRSAPAEARRFVVATGDALAFNTVYRDRNVAWPVQDLPFPLVFFCHRNPVDPNVGFQPENSARLGGVGDTGSPLTGTEDLLLYMDILEALVQAAAAGPGLPADAADLKQRLGRIRWWEESVRVGPSGPGQPLFDEEGNRRSGTGEHVVVLRPIVEGEQVQPKAEIEVWSWQAEGPSGKRSWRRQVRLPVDYDEASGEGGN
jgi:hypothetical protein